MNSCYLRTKSPMVHAICEIISYVIHLILFINNSWKSREILSKLQERQFFESSRNG